VLTRDAAIPVLDRIVCAQITTTLRGIRSEVQIGRLDGLPTESAITCDNVVTVHKRDLDRAPLGRLGPEGRRRVDRALSFALDIEPEPTA
jgi:mRNA interferase MazF